MRRSMLHGADISSKYCPDIKHFDAGMQAEVRYREERRGRGGNDLFASRDTEPSHFILDAVYVK